MTRTEYSRHDCTIKELKDSQPVVCVLTNHEYSRHDYTIKELKEATATPWFVSSQTTDTADTIKEL